MTRRTFAPHFSDAIRFRERSETLEAENVGLTTALIEARQVIERLRAENSDLVRRMSSEAFKLKVQSGCYSGCPVMRGKSE